MIEMTTAAPARGAAWLIEGFDYFKRSAGPWVGITILLLVINLASSIIPIAGFLIMQLLTPVFIGGLLLGCRDIGNGGSLQVNHLFAGFNESFGNLVVVGLLYTLGTIFIVVSMFLIMFITLGMDLIGNVVNGDSSMIMEHLNDTDLVRSVLLTILIGLSLFVPLLMALWFAPALVILEQQSPLDAMRNSFLGCLINVMPFLVYGILGLFLSILATIPLLLGWLILTPMLIASIYLAYIDIYKFNGPLTITQE